jgi:hypothetical protein
MGAIRKRDLATELGVQPSTITAYVKRGMPVRPDGLVDREKALTWVTRHITPESGTRGSAARRAARLLRSEPSEEPAKKTNGSRANGIDLDPAMQRARRDRALADRYETQNRELVGQLVRVSEMNRHVIGFLLPLRTRLLSLPVAAAPLVADRPASAVKETLQRLVYELLESASAMRERGCVDWALVDRVVAAHEAEHGQVAGAA